MQTKTRWILLSIGMLFFLSACEKSNQQTNQFSHNEPEMVYVSDKVSLDLAQVEAENPDFKKINRQERWVAQEDLVLPAGSKLLAVVDNTCQESGEMSDTVKGAEKAQNHIRRQAASISLPKEVTLSELSKMADGDPCLVEIANDGVMKATAVSNDTHYSKQLHLTSIKSSTANDILLSAGGLVQEVVIAVIDTGVQLNHPDLQANLWADGNGKNGYNFVANNTNPNDDNGHGTHCAGLAAAITNNNAGTAGVMPTKAKIMAIKVLDGAGGGSIASIINGIYYAIENKADVINMSLGGNTTSSALRKAVVDATAAGIVVFAAAGNSGADLAKSLEYPAAYAKDIAGLISVASIDSETKTLSNFSNYNKDYVEMAAPGSNGILSTYINGYAYLEGTSMATPILAGAGLATVSWLKSHGYAITAANVEAIMKAGAETNTALANFVQGSRSLNMLTLASLLKTNYADAKVVTVMPTPTPSPFVTERRCRSGRVNCGMR
ncbi:MAG: S8 family serine peptidase [Bdellovibrionaceae bacterium]|nr:S8 family serine peptidase [Pseudobdellovibrionaceae bacterium]